LKKRKTKKKIKRVRKLTRFQELMKWKKKHRSTRYNELRLWKMSIEAYNKKEITKEEFGQVVSGTTVRGEVYAMMLDVTKWLGEVLSDYSIQMCKFIDRMLEVLKDYGYKRDARGKMRHL